MHAQLQAVKCCRPWLHWLPRRAGIGNEGAELEELRATAKQRDEWPPESAEQLAQRGGDGRLVEV